MPVEVSESWSLAQRRLHWWIALLVFAGFGLGFLMVAVPLRALLLKFALYQLHKTIGLTVLILAVVRLTLLLRRGRPIWDPALPDWQRNAARAMHTALYTLLFAVPLLGYLTAATSQTMVPTLYFGVIPIPHLLPTSAVSSAALTQVHRVLAITLVALACGHGATVMHHHVRGSRILARMWRG